mmetsp:Transcript_30702/g.98767  ORF Transcript_30702/g.98767 Transcript_30702/m.98767 type:complete len:89 (+) Transcript_30702:171-437(+)
MSHNKNSIQLTQPAIRPTRTIEIVELEQHRVISSTSFEAKDKKQPSVKSDGMSCLQNLMKARSKASISPTLRPRASGTTSSESDTEDA